MKGKGKRKVNKKAIIVILLTLYLIIMAFYYVFTLPIKSIIIKGNDITSDKTIIKAAQIEDYPKMFSLSNKSIKKAVKEISTVKDVKVKKRLNGKITIIVSEAKVLFYNVLNASYVLDDKSEVSNVDAKSGIPVLVNYVPSDIYDNLISKMANIDKKVLTLISEIEYSPDIKNNITIDGNRFLFRMNDGNYVYINLANFDNISKYEEIYSTLDDTKKGILNLDSTTKKFLFKTFEAINKEKENDGGGENELPQ